MRRFRNQPNIAQKMMACAAAIFGKVRTSALITFNLLFSAYMLLQCRFMLYFKVIILVPCPSHLLKLLPGCTSVKMLTTVEHDFCTTCYERPPVLRPFLLCRRGGRPRHVLLLLALFCWQVVGSILPSG